MGLFGAPFAYRRLLTELRGIRRALERQADVLELQAQVAPRKGSQSFRSFSREKVASDGAGSSVSYVDPKEMERAFQVEGELVALLGRQPTPEELERGMLGDIE